ncbi:hypothetical protein LCGC14_0550090 [marine sediment metagenome]|uniref:Uncharacterized protein n=1 Tax=marine sediment metagenome TaxID=412755 RepID=A0A0F9S8N7_9ZZZZ
MKTFKKKNIEVAVEIRNKMLSWNEVNKLLRREFNNKKENKDFHDIGYKIELVNKLFNCNLNMDKREIAHEIQQLKIDSKFDVMKPEQLVKEIAKIQPSFYKRHVGFVFSSKYCHFHYPNKFPIYDRYARNALSNLLGKSKSYYESNYTQFKKDLDDLISNLSWKSSYKEMDTYLWLYGQWIVYKKYIDDESELKKRFSHRIRNFIKNHIELFFELDSK